MRLIAFVLAAFVAVGSASAQSWTEYSYPDYAFAVAFPADPQIKITTYKVSDGRSVPARVYSVRRNDVVFKMTVAALAGARLEESAVIDHAIRMLSESGTVTVNIPHRIYRVYGRQLSIDGEDGSHATVALFDYKGRLYQIEGIVLPGGNGSEADAMRFQQSLTFTGGRSNRSEDAIRAIREGCRSAGANPAGLDDPRCRR